MDAVDCLGEVNATEHEQYEPGQVLVEPASRDDPTDAVCDQRKDEHENGPEESTPESLSFPVRDFDWIHFVSPVRLTQVRWPQDRPVIPFGGARNHTTGDSRLEIPSNWLR